MGTLEYIYEFFVNSRILNGAASISYFTQCSHIPMKAALQASF